MSQSKTLFDKLPHYWSIFSAFGLMAMSILALIYDCLGRFAPQEKGLFRPSPEEALIFLVALVCGGMGSERLLTLRKLESNVEKSNTERREILARISRVNQALRTDFQKMVDKENALSEALDKVNKAEILRSDQIEAAARELLTDCDKDVRIRATAQYFPPQDEEHKDLSADYFDFVAKTVRRAKDDGGTMEYYVIVLSEEDQNAIDHKKAFQEQGIPKKLKMKVAKQQWPFEVLIGGHSMIIAIPGVAREKSYAVAVMVTDEKFVARAIEWYSDVLWPANLN